MIPSSTVVHDAIGAIETIAKEALSGVQIIDGPKGGRELEADVLVIGENQNGPAWIISRDGEPDMGGRCKESADIICVINSYSGDSDIAVRRARVVEILSQLEEAIRENPELNGTVDNAWIGEAAQGMQTSTTKGQSVTLGFSVHYEAWI